MVVSASTDKRLDCEIVASGQCLAMIDWIETTYRFSLPSVLLWRWIGDDVEGDDDDDG